MPGRLRDLARQLRAGLRQRALLQTSRKVEDWSGAALLHRVQWSSGATRWEDGPENYHSRFSPRVLMAGQTYRMRFAAPDSGLDTLLVQFGTFECRKQGQLGCVLRGPFGRALRSVVVDLSTLVDNAFHPLLALRGIRFRTGRDYALDLTLEAEPGQEVAVFLLEQPLEAGEKRPRITQAGSHPADDGRVLEHIWTGDRRHRFTKLAPGDTVVVCTHALPAGGAERQWAYLALGLKQAGYRVQFLVYEALEGDAAHYAPLLAAAGIPIGDTGRHPVSALAGLLAGDAAVADAVGSGLVADGDRLLRFVLSFRALRPAAVFAQLDDPNLYAGLGALLAGVPVVALSFRSVNPTRFPAIHQPWYERAYRVMVQSARVRLTGNSEAGNRDYESWLGLRAGRTAFIPNAMSAAHVPVPPAAAVAALRQAWGLVPGAPVVLGVFRLAPEKNPDGFLQVCARLRPGRPGLRVLVAGMGPLAAALAVRAAALGIADQVAFLGRRTDVNVLMRCASLLLLASDDEGTPNVVAEAQAMGLPVVATDAGGTSRAMLPGETGLLCPVGDIGALTAACAAVLDDPARAAAMGAAGQAFVQVESGIDLLAKRYVAVMQQPGEGRVSEEAVGARWVLGRGAAEVPVAIECRFFAALQTGGGVWKTTAAHRMDDVNAAFAALYRGPRHVEAMDVGASSGLSTVEWRDDMRQRGLAPRVLATDLMIDGVLSRIERDHYVLTDATGRVLQHEVAGRALHPDEFVRLPGGGGRAGAREPYFRWMGGRLWHRQRVRLVSPRARGLAFQADDLLGPPPPEFLGRFDVVRAANLLNLGYFGPEDLVRGVAALKLRLRGAGSMLVINRTVPDGSNHASLFVLDADGRFRVAGRVGDGSEIEAVVLAG